MFKKLVESSTQQLRTRIDQLEARLDAQLQTLAEDAARTRRAADFAATAVDEGGSVELALRDLRAQLQEQKQAEDARLQGLELQLARLQEEVAASGENGRARIEAQFAARLARIGRERDELKARRSPPVPPFEERAGWCQERIGSLRERGERGDALSVPALRLARAWEEVRALDELAHGEEDVALEETLFQRLDGALWNAESSTGWGEALGEWTHPDRERLADAETVLWAYRAQVARAWRDKRGLEPMLIVPSRTRFDVARHESSAHLVQLCADPALDDLVAGVERPGYLVREAGAERIVRRALVRRFVLQKTAPSSFPLSSPSSLSSSAPSFATSASSIAAPGSVPTTPGSVPTTPGSAPTSPASVPASSGSIPASPGYIPASSASVPTSSGSYPVTPATIPTSSGSAPGTPGSVPASSGSVAATTGSVPVSSASMAASSGFVPTSSPSIPASSGFVPASSGSIPASPGSNVASSGSVAASSGSIPASPAFDPGTSGSVPASPAYVPASSGSIPATPGSLAATPASVPGTSSSALASLPSAPAARPFSSIAGTEAALGDSSFDSLAAPALDQPFSPLPGEVSPGESKITEAGTSRTMAQLPIEDLGLLAFPLSFEAPGAEEPGGYRSLPTSDEPRDFSGEEA